MARRDRHADPQETSPLLRREDSDDQEERELLEFSKEDESNPRCWSRWNKLDLGSQSVEVTRHVFARNVAVIAAMAILGPLASSTFTPGISQIAESLNTTESAVIGCQTGYVVMLGIGPLILALLSETFGRNIVYLVCYTVFALVQIPTALSPNLPVLITFRTIAGLFGSISIANGGGPISDMYEPSERSGIFGWYLIGPLIGPVVVATSFFCLKETYVPVLLARRKKQLEETEDKKYYFKGEDQRPLPNGVHLAIYQALLFATTYSLYTQFERIYSQGYGFTTLQVGFLYLFPGLGFLTAVRLLIPRIDTVFNALTRKHNGESKPEYRLPRANIGSVLIPISLFWFAWTVEFHVHWFATISSTYFYGIGQIAIFNCVQNYYIDAFEKYAASTIAGGALFRSLNGGIVPIITPSIIDRIGLGWGFSTFAFVSVALAPSPILFYYYGKRLRKRFAIEL